MLQVEGAKHWDLYPSLSCPLALSASGTTIPPEALAAAEAQRVRVTLRQGETSFQYVPRGTVHVCTSTSDDAPSVHVTISATTTNTWLELFQRVLPLALHRLARQAEAPSLLKQVCVCVCVCRWVCVFVRLSVCVCVCVCDGWCPDLRLLLTAIAKVLLPALAALPPICPFFRPSHQGGLGYLPPQPHRRQG